MSRRRPVTRQNSRECMSTAITIGIGHNLPREPNEVFAKAVVAVDRLMAMNRRMGRSPHDCRGLHWQLELRRDFYVTDSNSSHARNSR